jgi:hypothetical protein
MTYSIEKSFLTLSLNIDFLFISAFPGFLVFGEVESSSYVAFKYFHLSHSELFVFYENIVQILSFLGNKSLTEDQSTIFCKDNNNLTYLWKGTQEISGNKLIKLYIEINSNNIVFEISLSCDQFNHFLTTLKIMAIASLSLKPVEKYVFKKAISASIEQILSFQMYPKCREFLVNILKDENVIYEISSIIIENLVDLLMHYNATILVIHKIEQFLIFYDKTQENLRFILTCN